MTYLGPSRMFRGKYTLPVWLRKSAPLYRQLIEQHGREKVDAVYTFFFKFVSNMKWGQWMVLDKVCPKVEDRQLFYWVMEMIYQSDLCSQMRFEYRDIPDKPELREVRIVVVAPPDELKKKWEPFLGKDRYLYIDWYHRLCRDPDCDPDFKPEWLMLDAPASEWGDGGNEQDDDGGVPPPPED